MVSERVFFFAVRDVAFRSRNLQEKTARQIKGVVCTSGNCQIASDFVRVSTVRRREKSSVRQRNWPERSDVIGWSLGFGCVLRTEISRISFFDLFFLRILKNLNSLAMLRIPPKKNTRYTNIRFIHPCIGVSNECWSWWLVLSKEETQLKYSLHLPPWPRMIRSSPKKDDVS